jgi:hypothetical protein
MAGRTGEGHEAIRVDDAIQEALTLGLGAQAEAARKLLGVHGEDMHLHIQAVAS